MSDEQENAAPPLSKLPRPTTTPTMAKMPLPSAGGARPPPLSVATTITGEKRKTPGSPAPPPAKRNIAGAPPKAGVVARSTGAPTTVRPISGIPATRAASSLATSRPETRSTTRSTTALGASRGTASSAARALASGPVRRPGSAGSTTSTSSASSARLTRSSVAGARRPPVSGAGSATRPGVTRGMNINQARSQNGRIDRSQNNRTDKGQNGRIESVEKMVDGFKELLEQEQAKISTLQSSHTELQTVLLTAQNTEREARRELSSASEEMAMMRAAHAREVDALERQLQRKEREKQGLEEELQERSVELGQERQTVRDLKQTLAEQATQHMTLSAQLTAAKTQVSMLQAEVERATLAVSAMKAELEVGKQKAKDAEERAAASIVEARAECAKTVAGIEEELREAETIRRKLHNQVQELKGNIRVFARVRPALANEQNAPDGLADIAYGDERLAEETGSSHLTVTSRSESATGKEREQVQTFVFDRVFQPKHGQRAVFEEISMLAQSVLDGYNVCIFAYGQTGSGKSWTMEGGEGTDAGMIPRAIQMIFDVSRRLKDRGWEYTMEGSFLEVYNDVINDLLGNSQFDSKKHEIKIDKDNKMTVTETVTLPLSTPQQVSLLLEKARSRRAVAATLMNERSSRSHSVFSLKVRGANPLTGEKCEGTLNLVDLAGSERLASSGAGENKDRLRETISINKSLSALADVISALGQGRDGRDAGHVPYRNSTLTRLLQTSLSGSSKTLMLCNISPLGAHLGETICSLRFATKVNTTPAGNAKRSLGRT